MLFTKIWVFVIATSMVLMQWHCITVFYWLIPNLNSFPNSITSTLIFLIIDLQQYDGMLLNQVQIVFAEHNLLILQQYCSEVLLDPFTGWWWFWHPFLGCHLLCNLASFLLFLVFCMMWMMHAILCNSVSAIHSEWRVDCFCTLAKVNDVPQLPGGDIFTFILQQLLSFITAFPCNF